MIRTQIQLTESQAEVLKNAAARRGVSMAELIRQSVDQFLVSEPSQEDLRLRAAQVAGRFRSGKKDISIRHDEYLSEALEK